MQISFGRKIPITQCQIYDNEQKEFTTATCYAFDCNDKSDIDEISKMDDSWRYVNQTLHNMKRGYLTRDNDMMTDIIVYTLETDNGEKLGLCCTEDKGKRLDVYYLETKQDEKHKYVGQTLLASVGSQILNNNQYILLIRNALTSAFNFYKNTCGFTEDKENSDLSMNRTGIRQFIKQTEARTQAPIIELKA